MKVSVIIPTYNAEKTIERAIDSVLNQTFLQYEIIVVDDCSTDNTFLLLQKLSRKISNMYIFQNERNSKSAFTRNVAIQHSSGEYIMQLDDDDYCLEDRMARQVEFLDVNKTYDFVGSNCFLFDDEGVYGQMSVPQIPDINDLKKTSPFVNPSVMFRKESLAKVDNYRVSKETERAQDYDLYLRMYVNKMKGYNLQENLLYYYKDYDFLNKSSLKKRMGELKFRYRNFLKLGLFPKAFPYIFKPVISFLIPKKLFIWNHQRRGISRKNSEN